jgi:hypothetical protein
MDLDADLAAFQSAPAAQLFTSASSKRPLSKFAQQRQAGQQRDLPQRFRIDEADLHAATPVKAGGLIGEITERGAAGRVDEPRPGAFASAEGFPLAATRLKAVEEVVPPSASLPSEPSSSPAVDEGDLHAGIAADSDAMLAAMSEQEILEAQEELKGMLSAETLDFLLKQKPQMAGPGA